MVPLTLLYARVFEDRIVRESCMNVLRAGVPIPLNSVIRRTTDALFPREKLQMSVQSYQGILHLYRFYCAAGLCEHCELRIMQGVKT